MRRGIVSRLLSFSLTALPSGCKNTVLSLAHQY